jgi:DNA-binding transcriptional regulator YhcF (GntR family)
MARCSASRARRSPPLSWTQCRRVHARYKLLVDTLAAEIRTGRLPPGTRMPTHRQLAAQEGLALVTATRVYAELEAMGLVSGETGPDAGSGQS